MKFKVEIHISEVYTYVIEAPDEGAALKEGQHRWQENVGCERYVITIEKETVERAE